MGLRQLYDLATTYKTTPSQYLRISDPLRAFAIDKACRLAHLNRPKERKPISLMKSG